MKEMPRLILALDVPEEKMDTVLAEVGDVVTCFKVGLNMIASPFLKQVAEKVKAAGGEIFLDGKLHDIPNTVANASRSLVDLGAGMFTVHASGGKDMMRAAKQAAIERAGELGLADAPFPVAVTVLTSMDGETWQRLFGSRMSMEDQVLCLVEEALDAGLDAVVASPLEVEAIKAGFGDKIAVITPGVRPAWAAAGDQVRIAEPGKTIAMGASSLVIGRPILSPPAEIGSRRRAVRMIMDEINQA